MSEGNGNEMGEDLRWLFKDERNAQIQSQLWAQLLKKGDMGIQIETSGSVQIRVWVQKVNVTRVRVQNISINRVRLQKNLNPLVSKGNEPPIGSRPGRAGSGSDTLVSKRNEPLIGCRPGRVQVRVRVQNITINRIRVQKSWTCWSLKETNRLSGLDPVGPGSGSDPLISKGNEPLIWCRPGTVRVRVRVQNITINRIRVQKSWTHWSLKETNRLLGLDLVRPGSGSDSLVSKGNEPLIGFRPGRVRVRVQNITINRIRVQKSWTRWSLKETNHLSGLDPVGSGSRTLLSIGSGRKKVGPAGF